MRIARILTRVNLGGPARQALASDPRLLARGHVVRVFAGDPEPGEGDLAPEFTRAGIDFVRIGGLGRGLALAGDVRALLALKRELRAFAPDVVHTHASKAGALGRRAARSVAPDAATVHTFHGHVLEGYFPEPLSNALVALERQLARRTDRIVAVSHATADDLVRLAVVDEARLVVVPPGIELAPFLAIDRRDGRLRELIGASPSDVVVGVIGRLAEVKRPEWALDVFELLATRHAGLHLVFVGDGKLRGMLERRILALPEPLRARAHLVGAREDMPAVLADLDVVLATSRSEGLPVALIEAAAAGRPAVATNVGGVSEIVAHERTGWLGTTVDELAYGLDQTIEQREQWPALAVRARLRVEKRHGADELATRLERLYEIAREAHACAS